MSRIKILLLVCMVSVATVCHAQQKISDGTAAAAINPNAILDLQSASKGLLLPRVALTSTTSATPIPHVNGMVVYNTATAGDVTPGYYYNDGAKWVRLANTSNIPSAWLLGGNTNGALKTIGTNDAFDLPITVKGTEAMRAIWDATNSVTRIAVGTSTAATVASATSGSSAEQQSAELTVSGGDTSINGVTVGKGGGQVASNTALGYQSLYNNLATGTFNTAVGNLSLYNNTTGTTNVGIGYQALNKNSTSSNNVAIGRDALYWNTAEKNTALGSYSGANISTGANNTTLGYHAGYNITTGANNIVIGASTDAASATASNQMNIGNAIFGTGMTGTSPTAPAGNIGIGTAAPAARLQIENDGTVPTAIFTGVGTQPATANCAYMSIDNATGQLYKAGQAEKVFYYQVYHINNVNGDWVLNFNTKIPSANYTLLVVGSYFDTYLKVATASSVNYFATQNVYAYVNSGTWRLTADVKDVNAQSNGNWTIYTMIVRNNQVVTNSDVTVDLSGSNSGAATASPVP